MDETQLRNTLAVVALRLLIAIATDDDSDEASDRLDMAIKQMVGTCEELQNLHN